MLIALHWTGRAVSENKRHALQYRRPRGSRGEARRVYIGVSQEYDAFKVGMAYVFRAQARGRTIKRPAARIQIGLPRGSQIDKLNLLKAIADALQLSGVIANDRELNYSLTTIPAVTWLDPGSDDSVDVYLTDGGTE